MLRRTLLLKVSSHGTMLWQLILGQPQIGSGNVPTSDDSYWAA
jgi:hypothetical protein